MIEHIGDGMVRVTTDDDRWYFKDGVAYPNVTGITAMYPKGPGLENWLISQPSKAHKQYELEVAGNRGSLVHEAAEQLMLGHEVKYADYPDVWKYIMPVAGWFEDHEPEIVAVEFPVFGERHGKPYAGTVDLLCKIDGAWWVIDWKTSKSVYPSHLVQVAAYADACREQFGIPPEDVVQAGVVRIGSQHKRQKKFCYGKGYEMKQAMILEGLTLFDACYALWENEHGGDTPRVEEYRESIRLAL